MECKITVGKKLKPSYLDDADHVTSQSLDSIKELRAQLNKRLISDFSGAPHSHMLDEHLYGDAGRNTALLTFCLETWRTKAIQWR